MIVVQVIALAVCFLTMCLWSKAVSAPEYRAEPSEIATLTACWLIWGAMTWAVFQ